MALEFLHLYIKLGVFVTILSRLQIRRGWPHPAHENNLLASSCSYTEIQLFHLVDLIGEYISRYSP